MKNNQEAGFSAVGAVLVVLIFGVIGFAGWRVYQANGAPVKQNTAKTQTNQAPASAPQVNSAEDLDEAEDFLNNQNIDQQLDTSAIDQSLSTE